MDRVTKPQKKMLITLLRETKNMEGKKEKEWYWEKIQAALNTIGPKKTIIQWKKCWRDMRLTTRKKLAELKRCQLAGGSPPPGIELNHEDNDIIDIVGTQYFYEEINGELKPEAFLPNFDYVPEHFCDAILTAAAASGAGHAHQHMQTHAKESSHVVQQQHDHQTNDTETNDAPVTSEAHGAQFQTAGFAHVQHYNNSVDHESASQQSNTLPHAHAFHGGGGGGGLHPHLLRRQQQQQQASLALKRENNFEEKLLQFLQEAFPKKHKKRKSRDPDKLFLLSLYDEIKRIPVEIRLEVKSELLQVLKRYQKKSSIKQEKSYSQSTASGGAKHNNGIAVAAVTSDKSQLPQQQAAQQQQLANSMYQLQKKYDKNEKESSPQQQQQSLVEAVQHNSRETSSSAAAATVPLHASQQMSHSLFDFHKKFEDSSGEKSQQKEQRPSASHQQHAVHQQQQQPAPPPPASASNEQQHHIHHPQMSHGIIFPLSQIRNEQQQQQSATQQQQHHPHNPHQQQQSQAQQHHPSAIFGTSTPASAMSADRSALPYENVG